MKKEELKKILKPLIKDCIKEVIFEEGVLSNIVSEVVKGVGTPIVEQNTQSNPVLASRSRDEVNKKIAESRKRMLEAIGKESYGGVDLFENTEPMVSSRDDKSPLAGSHPRDPGVDISSIPGMGSWGALAMAKKER